MLALIIVILMSPNVRSREPPRQFWLNNNKKEIDKPTLKGKQYSKRDRRNPNYDPNRETSGEDDDFNLLTNHGEGTSNRYQRNLNNINKPLDDIIKENGRHVDRDDNPYIFGKKDNRVDKQKDNITQKVTKRSRNEDDEDSDDNLDTPIYKKSNLYDVMQNLLSKLSSKVETPSVPTLTGGGKNDLDQFSTYPYDILKLTYKTRNIMEQLEDSIYSTGNFNASKFEEIKRTTAAMSRLSALNIRSLYVASTHPNLTTHLGHTMSMAAYAYKDNAPSTLKDPKEEDKLWPEDANLRESWPMEKNRSYAQQAAASLGITFRNGFNNENRSFRPRFNPSNLSPFPFGSLYDSSQGGVIPAPPPRGGGLFPVHMKSGGYKR
jgi:hypothetical protein